jgi:hypothetical protein
VAAGVVSRTRRIQLIVANILIERSNSFFSTLFTPAEFAGGTRLPLPGRPGHTRHLDSLRAMVGGRLECPAE